MNPRIIDWGVPALLGLVTITCCVLLATADTYTPSAWSLVRNWSWYWF